MVATTRGLRKKAPFYGWIVVVAAAISYFFAGGVRAGAFGVFLKPISGEFGWTRAATAAASSLGSMEGAIQGPIIGAMVDKFGTRMIMWTGFAIGAAGFVVLGFVNSLALFYVVYVLLVPMGVGAVQLAGQAAVANWFIKKRTRAFAVLTTGFALGGALLTPSIGWLLHQYGWRAAAVILGIVMGIVGFGVVPLVRHRPEPYGYVPDGEDPAREASNRNAPPGPARSRGIQVAEVDFTLRQALRTTAFWLLAIAFMVSSIAASSVMVHAIPLLTDKGVSPQAAANYVGLSFFWGVAGRLMWGAMGDFLSKRYLLAVAIVVQGAGIFALAHFATTFHIHLYAALFGVGQAIVPVQFAIRGEYFGRRSFATIGGIMQGFATLGGVIGPVYAGFAYDVSGSYTGSLTVVAVGSLLSAALFILARRPAAPGPPTRQ